MELEETIRRKFVAVSPELDERARRIWAATEAQAIGRGGMAIVARATGLHWHTVAAGLRELELLGSIGVAPSRVRRQGAGRKPLVQLDPTLVADLIGLVEPVTRGDPMGPLLWTTKSLRTLAKQLRSMGHTVGHNTVGTLLAKGGYSLQSNRKTKEGSGHPDRDAQFRHINRRVKLHQVHGAPVISVDTKKKELVGDFKNEGQTWRLKGQPELVRVHDFLIPSKGKAIPYGVYDLTRNDGWVTVGIDHDTAAFAVNSIRRWWAVMGQPAYPTARELLITADGGGSNGTRLRLWKWELQQFADESGLKIRVSHFPPGTSKWNKIEHRLFSYISKNWRGQPLESLAAIVSLIASTATETGLRVRCELDTRPYPKGRKISDADMESLNLRKGRFHGDWNYTIVPRSPTR